MATTSHRRGAPSLYIAVASHQHADPAGSGPGGRTVRRRWTATPVRPTVNDVLVTALHLAIADWDAAPRRGLPRIGVLVPANLRREAWGHRQFDDAAADRFADLYLDRLWAFGRSGVQIRNSDR